MRDELHMMELVDRYLDGSMTKADLGAFEARAATDQELRELIEDQRTLREGMARIPVRVAAAKAHRAYRFGKPGPWIGGTVLIAITAATCIYLWKHNARPREAEVPKVGTEIKGTAVASEERGLHPLTITIDPEKDTTLLSPYGIVLDVPKNCFLDSTGRAINGPVTVTLLEAFDRASIIKAGLTTMSGDTLLETGGMFYLKATQNGREVRIDPAHAITAMVPAAPEQRNMQLYQGVELPDGTIDWRNPRPLKKSLVPVEITTLDFYPPGYETKLAELGHDVMDKAFKDSLYYSFAGTWDVPAESDSVQVSLDSLFASRWGLVPSKVKAIWNARFNNTNLATREFEERMKVIHGTCDNAVLDLYVNNLKEDLGTLDRRAVGMGHSEFERFAARNDGRVDLPAECAERLARTYNEWSRAAAEASRRTQEGFWKEQQQLDNAGQLHQNQQAQRRLEQDLRRFEREYNANLANACRQLGIEKLGPTREPPILAYQVVIPRSGWWNLDRAVYWMTSDRTTGSWMDERTRKVATIEYAPFTVEVVDRKNYEDVMVYLVPKEIRSYQRMNDGGHRFSESRNKAFTYDVVCLARRGQARFAAQRSVAEGSMEERMVLEPMDDERLDSLLADQDASVSKGLAEESRYAVWASIDRERRANNTALVELRNQLLPIVFPCGKERARSERTSVVLDRPARYPDGEDALSDLLTISLRNADDPLVRYVEGRVEVAFWVLEDGTVHDPRIIRPLYPTCDQRALELFRTMSKWEPAIRGGKPKRVEYAREVVFVKEGYHTRRRAMQFN